MSQLSDQPQATALNRSGKSGPLQLLSLGILLIIIGLVLGVVLLITRNPRPTAVATPNVATVHITSQGFEPATLEVKRGTEVVWVSDDTAQTHTIASNPYPADNALPGLKSSQLGNTAQYRYTFDHSGTYKYHDDLNPNLNGVVTVQ